ncbi:GDP-mannose 4,6-dehydratase [Candidatus Peregrinibacteria bacterium]|nr:GDP-mannose 4,6-dehydratase [Candidatus Peregrinibacteria bacterium]
MVHVLVIGGAGFIGSNAAHHYLKKGCSVSIFDNLSRKGTDKNIEWLKKEHNNRVEMVKADIVHDCKKLKESVQKADIILHLAAQVAVTTSVTNPREDFEINAIGTFNLLEAMRETKSEAILLFSSSNKVYGGMEDIEIIERNGRYEYKNMPYGISETSLLDFHSPYGCSKGAADQYVRDYARIYSLKTIVFRQSCIYGYRQFGIEDQGWVAWFTIAALLGKPITIYGDGKQVRDVLFIDDLVRAFDMAIENISTTKGKIYNIGGGAENQMSLLELLGFLEKFMGTKIVHSFSNWRPGDQPVFVSDIRKAEKEFGWKPKVAVPEGVEKLEKWVKSHKELFDFLN